MGPSGGGVPLIQLSEVTRSFRMGAKGIIAVNSVTLTVETGDYIAITGPSGSGKSTLLQIIGCLDTPTTGRYALQGLKIDRLTDVELSQVRNSYMGFVFQSFHLLPELNVAENVELPLLYRDIASKRREDLVRETLESVGLFHRRRHRPGQLSGGERQRAAIARAVVGGPKVLLADEPTGNLDQESGDRVMDLLESLNRRGVTVMLVTHDPSRAGRASKICTMRDGALFETRGGPVASTQAPRSVSPDLPPPRRC